jgi:hypothetical protein
MSVRHTPEGGRMIQPPIHFYVVNVQNMHIGYGMLLKRLFLYPFASVKTEVALTIRLITSYPKRKKSSFLSFICLIE